MDLHYHIIAFALVTTMLSISQGAVNKPPRIITQPKSNWIFASRAPITIECEAIANPNATYSWTKNGKPFNWKSYGNRISEEQGRGTLIITNPQEEDIAYYQCFAQNELGVATSESVFINKGKLNDFPIEEPKRIIATEGEPFQLKCIYPDAWPKPFVKWILQSRKDDRRTEITNPRLTMDHEGNLWFSNVTKEDASVDFYYACIVSSIYVPKLIIGNRVILFVIENEKNPLKNENELVHQYVTIKNKFADLGTTLTLFCIFGGTPQPETVWTKDGTILQSNDTFSIGHHGKSLTIWRSKFEDAGDYTCNTSNGVGNDQSNSINLQITSKPSFTVKPEIQIASKGEEIVFKCEAFGVPEPTIEWIYNGKPITQAEANPRRLVQTNKIIIQNVVEADIGNYGCNATNSEGYVYKDVYLNVLSPELRSTSKPIYID